MKQYTWMTVAMMLWVGWAASLAGQSRATTSVARKVHTSRQVQIESGRLSSDLASDETLARGYLWSASHTPIPGATVQIRDVVSGRVAMITSTNAEGVFAFPGVPTGTYIIEYVRGGTIISAVGHPFTVVPGEVVVMFVRVSNDIMAHLTENVVAVGLQAASSVGVARVMIDGIPASAVR